MTVSAAQAAARNAAKCSFPAQGRSLIFSLEVEESPFAAHLLQVQCEAQLSLLRESLRPLLQPRGPFHSKLLRDVRLFQHILLAEEGEVDGVVLASKLTIAGYRVAVRQALGGGSGTAVFSNLRHSFLLVTAQDCPCAGIDFIVEPHFREQFEISHPTSRYSGLLAMLPSVMVGTAAQLTPLVQLLCAEMSLAFEQHGLSLPPWRQSKSLLSKWLPSKARDFDLSPYSSPRAVSPDGAFQLSFFAPGQQPPPLNLDAHQSASEASGSLTPAFSVDEDASPRAVLNGASAMLLSQQQQTLAGGGRTGVVTPPSSEQQLRPKSLLSSSLAANASKRRLLESSHPAGGTAGLDGSSQAAAATAATQQQQLQSAAVIHQGGRTGMTYRISSEWQQPAIRTVKMQGQQQVQHARAAAASSLAF